MFISVIGCTNPTKDKYAEATQLMESGKYIEAQKIFEELLNYKDCHNKAKQCKYLYAVQLVNESDYYAAIQAFNNVSYEDSKEKISEVLSIAANKYLKNQISKEEFDKVLNEYDKIMDISDNSDIFYLRATELYSAGSYKNAYEYTRYINDIDDAKKLCDDARYMKAIADCKEGDLSLALIGFESLSSDKYRNSVTHAIQLRREILCTPFYGEENLENGNGKTYMLFQKSNDVANGFVSGFKADTGELLITYKFVAFFAYDGILLAKDGNVYNLKTCSETITQTGKGENAVYSIRFNEGPLNGMSFESDPEDNENPVYSVLESPAYIVNQEVYGNIKQKYLNYDCTLTLPKELEKYLSVSDSNLDERSSTEDEKVIGIESNTSLNNSADISSTESNVISNDSYSNVNSNTENVSNPNNTNSKSSNTTSSKPSNNINSKPTNNTSSKPSSSVHTHSYSNATCTKPATCSCGATKGTALGHSWKGATCKIAKTCNRCGQIEGSKLNHSYKNEKCTMCGEKSANFPKVSDIKLEYPASLKDNGVTFKILSYEINNMDEYFEGKAKIKITAEIIEGFYADITANFGIKYYDINGNDITKWKPYDSDRITKADSSRKHYYEVGDIGISEFEIPVNCRKIVLISRR